jgi:hypothetical protein
LLSALVLVALSAGGCIPDGPVAPEAAYSIAVASGEGAAAQALASPAAPLAVRVTNHAGDGVKGVRVRFAIDRASASGVRLADSAAVTDEHGLAGGRLALASDSATLSVRAWIAAAPGREVRFTARVAAAGHGDRAVRVRARAAPVAHHSGVATGGLPRAPG